MRAMERRSWMPAARSSAVGVAPRGMLLRTTRSPHPDAHVDREGPVPPIVHDVLRSHGQPLAAGVRADMERRFGHDFSRVRVFADGKAGESARAVNAQAYTVGRNVVFAEGRYAPETSAGRTLLAHELAHTTQAAPGEAWIADRISEPGDQHERAADGAASQALAGGAAGAEAAAPSAGGVLLRKKDEVPPPRGGKPPSEHRSSVGYEPSRRRYVVSIDDVPVAAVTVPPGGASGVTIQVDIQQSIEGTYADVLVLHDGSALLQTYPIAVQLLRPSIIVLFKEVASPQDLARLPRRYDDKLKPVVPHSVQEHWMKAEFDKLVREFQGKSIDERLVKAGETAYRLRTLADSDLFADVDRKVRDRIQAAAAEIERLVPKLAEARKKNLREEKIGSGKVAGAVFLAGVTAGGGPEDIPADALAGLAAVAVLVFGIGQRTTMVMRDPDLPRRQAEELGDLLDRLTESVELPVRPPTARPVPPPPLPLPRPVPRQAPRTQRVSPEPKAEPKPEPTPRIDPIPPTPDPDRRRERCQEIHPDAMVCDVPARTREQVVAAFLVRNGYRAEDLTGCVYDDSFPPGRINACNGAPGEIWHCGVKGTTRVVSVFGCLCCNTDGTTSYQWEGEHFSAGGGRSGRRPR